LAAYEALAAIHDVGINGMPADLVARRASLAVLDETSRTGRLRAAATALENDLKAGRWLVDRIAWELTVADLERWIGQPLRIDNDRRIYSLLAESLWSDWQQHRQLPFGPRAVVAVN